MIGDSILFCFASYHPNSVNYVRECFIVLYATDYPFLPDITDSSARYHDKIVVDEEPLAAHYRRPVAWILIGEIQRPFGIIDIYGGRCAGVVIVGFVSNEKPSARIRNAADIFFRVYNLGCICEMQLILGSG